LTRLETLLNRGLERTAHLWPPIQIAYRWVHSAAHLLGNAADLSGQQVRRRFIGLLGAMTRWQPRSGELEGAIAHFLKVTRSYWPGLFHCYDVPDLPRTNNDLEHLFGQHRYLERRITGRKVASAALVIRGSVRIVAAVMTRLRPFSADDLVPPSITQWQSLRAALATARRKRTLQRRFRQNPDTYLADLENRLVQLILPP
jgi:hypothetical protein